jgi:hypothetical protein
MLRLKLICKASLLIVLSTPGFSFAPCPLVSSPRNRVAYDARRFFLSDDDNNNSNNNQSERKKSGGPFDFLFNPYSSNIPKEIEAEIYAAEANTATAKNRNARVALYIGAAFIGVLLAFFNGFITELRTPDTPDGVQFSLQDAGFSWVESNLVFRFLFMNKIGGGLSLLAGGAAALLAEAEYDTRRINAEKIFEEMKRRRDGKQSPANKAQRKKKRSSKESKHLRALAEIVSTQDDSAMASVAKTDTAIVTALEQLQDKAPTEKNDSTQENTGVLGTVKSFYKNADAMAASQALLLNKKLEDVGLLEKITDESGLKVIGKEAAAKVVSQGNRQDPSEGQKET